MPLTQGTVASPLGDWTFARYAPQATEPTAASLQSAWYFDGVLAHRRERVFPQGTHGVVVQLDEPHRTPSGSRFPPVVYNGMGTRAIVVEAPVTRVRVIGLDFSAASGFAIADRNVRESVDEAVDFRELAGPEAEQLLDACRRERTPAATLMQAVRWFTRRLSRADACEPSVSAAVARIERARGRVRMRDLAAGIGSGERALERAFRDRVGITPKRYARISRFSHAHELLIQTSGSLADVASRAGYYDQAHFNADFREHAGLSPMQYLASQRYPGSRSLVEP